ncbi:MAG: DNA-binding response regulator [Gammaproteobacteria bacterium RIFCSPLOWO2_02_FULL_61_13]|nr:MAG: DNA-binding response regulator [Gammaproteobacteria bacterium RIFCSPLOWO2_02_FULL_61_13]
MPIRIVLADDHALVRQGVRALLAAIADFEVVGEAANGREALKLIRALAPEVALMDISMPELNGLDATAHALREQPHLKVIIVSMHATEAYVLEALRAGAAGYLLKDADADELERAIRAVARGERYLTPSVSHHVIERFMRAERGEQTPEAEALSPRQREVLQLVAEGRGTREIADRLNLSVKTIETHRAQLMQRLEIYDVAGLTRYALRIGLIDPER